MTHERKKKLIQLALISFLIDFFLSMGELPFFGALPVAISVEEMAELLISTLIARNQVKLDLLDRMLGFLPIPGITAVTVAVARELLGAKSKQIQ